MGATKRGKGTKLMAVADPPWSSCAVHTAPATPHEVTLSRPHAPPDRRRWKVERLFAWLQNDHRLLTRFEYHADNSLGFVHLGCILILLRCYL